jgi:hypothetical protein
MSAACAGPAVTVSSATPAPPATTVPAAAPSTARLAPSPVQQASGPANQEQLDAAADAVTFLARSYQDAFTGLTLDLQNGRLVVYRKPGTGFDSALAQLALGVPVDLRNAPRSISELASTRDQVVPLMQHTTGYSIITVGAGSEVSYAQGVVEIGVTGDLALAKRELGERFGDRVVVSATEPLVG